MTDYVLENDKNFTTKSYLKNIKYAEFLTQPLKLEMFVTTDDEGNVLEMPRCYNGWKRLEGTSNSYFNDYCIQYQQALKKVLFKGFEIVDDGDGQLWLNDKENEFGIWVIELKDKTIQDLVHLNLERTENYKI